MASPTHAADAASCGPIKDSSTNISSCSSPTRDLVAGVASDRLDSITAGSNMQPNLIIEWKEELDGSPANSSYHCRRNAEPIVGVSPFINKPAGSEASAQASSSPTLSSFSSSTTPANQAAIAAQAASVTMQSTPTLLGLPAELRSTIFELAATFHGDSCPEPCIYWISIHSGELSQPDLALVNKQVRSEVLPMWRHICLHEVEEVEAYIFDYEFSELLNFLREFPKRRIHFDISLSFSDDLSSTRDDRREGLKKWIDSMKDRSGENFEEDDYGYYGGIFKISYRLSDEDEGRGDWEELFEEVDEMMSGRGNCHPETFDMMCALNPDGCC